ncbi:MAG TPA: hypothetical protein VFS21_13635 [Roseiflexaceae bacterium]|nr:hypothetical protein [Roseiflexaceae bacterium]
MIAAKNLTFDVLRSLSPALKRETLRREKLPHAQKRQSDAPQGDMVIGVMIQHEPLNTEAHILP